MGYRHDRDEMLSAAMRVALADGLGALTFRRVAHELGASDRMVVYYFPTKSDLVVAVVTALGAQLQATLEVAFGPDPLDADELMRRAWPVLASASAATVFNRFFEIIGLALAGQAPYAELAPLLLVGSTGWQNVCGRPPRRNVARSLPASSPASMACYCCRVSAALAPPAPRLASSASPARPDRLGDQPPDRASTRPTAVATTACHSASVRYAGEPSCCTSSSCSTMTVVPTCTTPTRLRHA
jgi:AcrR family transcriptional regulator